MSPLVSVIIPVFNGARYLAEAIESAASQEYEPMELIVADDGSSDDSAKIARGFPGVRVLDLEHEGVSAARNSAVLVSKGEWLAFLDSDDVWLPGKVALQVEAAEANGVDIVLCERRHKFESVPHWFVWPIDEVESKVCFEPSAWLVRREAFDRVGPFEHGRALGEDLNWLIRAWTEGAKHTTVRQPLILRRIHDSNASAQLPTAETQLMSLLRESIAIKHARRSASG